MKRLLLAGISVLVLSACGSGGGSVVSANSTDSTEITAVGTIVGNGNSAGNSNAPADNSTADNSTAAAATTTENATALQDAASADTVDDAAVASNDSGQ